MAQGGTVTPPCNRKGRAGNPPPKGARASALPDNPVHLDAFLFGLYTGMRRGEILALRWEDVDPVKGLLRVEVADRIDELSGVGRRDAETARGAVFPSISM